MVVNSLKINKSSGLDGLTAEFYQAFWDDIGDVLTKVYNEAFEYQELNLSQKVSVLSLKHKSGSRGGYKTTKLPANNSRKYRLQILSICTR